MKIRLIVRGNFIEYTYDSYELEPQHCLDIPLYPNVQYAVGIDPSTTRTGLVIGNLVDYQADYFLLFERNREIDDTEFNRNLFTFAQNFFNKNANNIQGAEIEKPFRHAQTTQAKFAVQQANFKMWTTIMTTANIDYYTCVPASWRGTFTKQYGHLIKGDLRKITKNQIKSVYVKANNCQELLLMPSDISDAYGIYQHYLSVNKDNFTASKEKEREYKHNVMCIVTDQENLQSFVNRYLDIQKKLLPTAKPVVFNYCQQLTPEDNIRCFTSAKNNSKYNVFVSPVFPNISMMKHLYKCRGSLPSKISANKQLYVIGFRQN